MKSIVRIAAVAVAAAACCDLGAAWADTLTVEIHALTETAMEAVELVDTIIAELEAALADRQLGGAVDFLEVGQPQPVIADEIGVPPLLAATVPITLYYTSDRASG